MGALTDDAHVSGVAKATPDKGLQAKPSTRASATAAGSACT